MVTKRFYFPKFKIMLTYIIKITAFFYTDDGRYYYRRNVSISLPNCLALHPTRLSQLAKMLKITD
jgi:hypothetical protein